VLDGAELAGDEASRISGPKEVCAGALWAVIKKKYLLLFLGVSQ